MLYDFPQYYEAAFSFRDLAAETGVMERCIETFSLAPVQRVLEIACGPAPHAGELAARGYRLFGLDINPNMLDYARRRWHGLKPAPTFLRGDMVSFTVPTPVDFVYVMLGSLYLDDRAELISHLDSVAAALPPGGLYLLDSCLQFADPLAHNRDNAYVIRCGDMTVRSTFAVTLLDQASRLYEEIWNVRIDDRGTVHEFRTVEHNRALLPDDFRRLIDGRQDFELLGSWEDWDLDRPITAESETTRPLTLIRRLPTVR